MSWHRGHGIRTRRQLITSCLQSGGRESKGCWYSTYCLLFILSGTPPHGRCYLHLGWVFPHSVGNSSQIHTEICFLVILNPTKSPVNAVHHTIMECGTWTESTDVLSLSRGHLGVCLILTMMLPPCVIVDVFIL